MRVCMCLRVSVINWYGDRNTRVRVYEIPYNYLFKLYIWFSNRLCVQSILSRFFYQGYLACSWAEYINVLYVLFIYFKLVVCACIYLYYYYIVILRDISCQLSFSFIYIYTWIRVVFVSVYALGVYTSASGLWH